jgi:hypothetical protein
MATNLAMGATMPPGRPGRHSAGVLRLGRLAVSAAALLILLLWGAGASAHPPYGLAADRQGNVYFSDLEAVWRLGPDNSLSVFVPAVPGTHVHELAVTPDGAVEGDRNRYDPGTQRFYTGLWRRGPDGAETQIVPLTETSPEGLGVWRDGRGNRYTTSWPSSQDRRTMLTRRTAEGRAELLFAEGKPPASLQRSVASTGGFAFGADGAVYFADRHLLRRLGTDGKVTLLHARPKDAGLRGLAMAADGAILAADLGRRLVLRVGAAGGAGTLYRSPEGWSPTAVAERNGLLLVLEANTDPREYRNRVRLVEVSGEASRVLAAPGDRQAPLPAPPPQPRAPAKESNDGGEIMLALLGAGGAAAGFAALRLRRRP